MTSRAEWAGFLASTVASSMVVPAAFETSIYNFIIFRVADMPDYFQLSIENRMSRLRTYFSYRVSSVLLPLNMNFSFASPTFRFISGFWIEIITSVFSTVTSSVTL
jgi:hypothetical protein